MNRDLMLQLRRVAEAAPEHRLHMRNFCESEAACGTAYCLAGFAAVDPWFRANTTINRILEVAEDDETGELLVYETGVLPEGVSKTDEERVYALSATFVGLGRLFDLRPADAYNLFGGGLDYAAGEHAVGKDEVLWNVDALLRGEAARPYAASGEDGPYAGEDDD